MTATATIDLAAEKRRRLVAEELTWHMQEISERAFGSRWGYRLEDTLPPVLFAVSSGSVAGEYNAAIITPLYAGWLVSLATELGHWINLDANGDPFPYYPSALRRLPTGGGPAA